MRGFLKQLSPKKSSSQKALPTERPSKPRAADEEEPVAKEPAKVLVVTVVGASGLDNSDRHGRPDVDAYVLFEIQGKTGCNFQTRTIYNSFSPEWNHERMVEGFAPGDKLRFTIYNQAEKGSNAPDSFLAKAELDMLFYPEGFEGTVQFTKDSLVDYTLSRFSIKVRLVDRDQALAARKIQKVRRGQIGRMEASLTRKKEMAATKIQAMHRGRVARARAQERKMQELQGATLAQRLAQEHEQQLEQLKAAHGRLPDVTQILLLLFPTAPWPPPSNFQADLVKALDNLGATNLDQLTCRLQPGSVIAQFVGTGAAVQELYGCRGIQKVKVQGHEASRALVTSPEQATVVRLRVKIRSAQDLRHSDTNGEHLDSYCTCAVSGKPESGFKTEVAKNSLFPVWNSDGDELEISPQDSLDFIVREAHYHGRGTDLLGQVTFSCASLIPHGLNGDVYLQLSGKEEPPRLKLSVAVQEYIVDPKNLTGTQQLNRWKKGEEVLLVTIVSASAIHVERTEEQKATGNTAAIVVGKWDKADPFASVEIAGKPQSLWKTHVHENTPVPRWDETNMVRDYMPGDSLLFQVWNWNPPPRPDELLGKVVVPDSVFRAEGFDGELRLSDAGEGLQAHIKIKIWLETVTSDVKAELAVEVEKSMANFSGTKVMPKGYRVLPGQVLKPQMGTVFGRLHNDHYERVEKIQRLREAISQQQEQEINSMACNSVKTAPQAEVEAACERLYVESEHRRKKFTQWRQLRQEQLESEYRDKPEINHHEVDTDETPRFERLYAIHERKEARLERLREEKQTEEMQHMEEQSVHANAEAVGDTEVFDRLYQEGSRRMERKEQREQEFLRSLQQVTESRYSQYDEEDLNRIIEASSTRLYNDAQYRQRRIEDKQKREARDRQGAQAGKKGDPHRFDMLYHDSFRRNEWRRLMQARHDMLEVKMPQVRRDITPPPDWRQKRDMRNQAEKKEMTEREVNRIFSQLYNPQSSRRMELGDRRRRAKSDNTRRRRDGEEESEQTSRELQHHVEAEQLLFDMLNQGSGEAIAAADADDDPRTAGRSGDRTLRKGELYAQLNEAARNAYEQKGRSSSAPRLLRRASEPQQAARKATPTATAKRRTVTGQPKDTRKSLLRPDPDAQLIDDDLRPRSVIINNPEELGPALPSNIHWDTRPLWRRSLLEEEAGAQLTEDGEEVAPVGSMASEEPAGRRASEGSSRRTPEAANRPSGEAGSTGKRPSEASAKGSDEAAAGKTSRSSGSGAGSANIRRSRSAGVQPDDSGSKTERKSQTSRESRRSTRSVGPPRSSRKAT